MVRVDGFHVALFQRAAGIRRLLVDLKGTQSIGVVSLKGWGEVFQDKENPLKFHLHTVDKSLPLICENLEDKKSWEEYLRAILKDNYEICIKNGKKLEVDIQQGTVSTSCQQ